MKEHKTHHNCKDMVPIQTAEQDGNDENSICGVWYHSQNPKQKASLEVVQQLSWDCEQR